MQYYTVKLKSRQPIPGKEGSSEEGSKSVTEDYLVQALSVTEAEAKVLNWCPSTIREPEVKSVGTSNVVEIKKHGDAEDWFLTRIADPIEDKSGKVKLTFFFVMINGTDLINAATSLKENFKGTVSDYEINSITKSKIIVDEDLIDPNYKYVNRGEGNVTEEA